jgi:magnesium transporter
MIQVMSVRDGKLMVTQGIPALAGALEDDHPDWVWVVDPSPEEMGALCERLGLHDLAVRDALTPQVPPKISDFGDHLFFIVHTPVPKAWSQTRKIAFFLAASWIVTVQRTQSDSMDEIARRVQADPVHMLRTPDTLAHAAIDHLTGGFEALTTDLLDEIAALEESILTRPARDMTQRMLKVRRSVVGLLRVTRAQRDVCAALCRTASNVIHKATLPYLRDVYDHVLRLFEMLEGARESLATTREAYLSVVNNRLSEIMRTLTMIATVLMPLSLLAGIYGMNFDVLPLREHPAGFWITLALMAGIGAGMVFWFRMRRWY